MQFHLVLIILFLKLGLENVGKSEDASWLKLFQTAKKKKNKHTTVEVFN